MKSPCTSNKHSEYTCLIKWGVSSKKFTVDKWCKDCIEHHNKTYIVQEHIKNAPANEPKKKRK
jgi:hypothetical protein